MVGSVGYQKRYALTSVKKFSFTDNNATWKAKRQASNEKFLAQQTTTASLFSTSTNAVAGQVQLTTQLVQSRLQSEMNAKLAERQSKLDELYSGLDMTV
ncbi:hypothetical protein [Breoghania corrubedonensis]|uniref:hypothetical protein n=1 Tax=Breoghania corrubedonensis TaxID=665038 RepID=UPI0011B22775|nr:hypothetical protein [Breoghania corrubedonensis]